MRQKIAGILILLLVLQIAAGCTVDVEQAEKNGYTFIDARGNEVTIDQPNRVISLMGSFTEIWILSGGTVVGVTSDAFDERDISGLNQNTPIVGTYQAPNAEEIIALQPDFVLLSSETASHVELESLLKSAGVPIAYFNVTYFSDYLEMLKICTAIHGREDLYQKYGEDVRKEIETIVSHVKLQEPSVLLLITYSGGAIVKGSDCMAGEMLKKLGCVNLADAHPSLLQEFSMEQIIEEDPEYIFVIPMGNSDELAMRNLKESIESNPVWKDLKAVRNHNYISLPKELFLYKTNHRWAESYAYLVEVFADEK